MRSSHFQSGDIAAFRGRWGLPLDVILLLVLFQSLGCVRCPPQCRRLPPYGGGAGCLREDLCACHPASGVLPPPECFLMLQSARVQPAPSTRVVVEQPSRAEAEGILADTAPYPPDNIQPGRQTSFVAPPQEAPLEEMAPCAPRPAPAPVAPSQGQSQYRTGPAEEAAIQPYRSLLRR